MIRTIFSCLALICFVGCQTPCVEPTAPISNRCRPQIALIPVRNACDDNLPGNVERELNDNVLDCLMSGGQFWVSPYNQFQTALEQTRGRDYFGLDLSYANHFSHNDFLIVVELIDHRVVPFNKEEFPDVIVTHIPDRHQVLMLSMRVRVLDLRYEEPTIVRQEVVDTHQLITPKWQKCDYSTSFCQTNEYLDTPLAKARRDLASEVCERIQEAIFWAW